MNYEDYCYQVAFSGSLSEKQKQMQEIVKLCQNDEGIPFRKVTEVVITRTLRDRVVFKAKINKGFGILDESFYFSISLSILDSGEIFKGFAVPFLQRKLLQEGERLASLEKEVQDCKKSIKNLEEQLRELQ
jgi:hypothetical protein